MKLLVATITFAVTMGALFLIDNRKTNDAAEKNYAQVLEGLSATENPTTTSKTVTKKSVSKTQTAQTSPSQTPTPLEPAATNSSLSPTGQAPSPQPTGYQIELVSIVPTPPIKQNSTVQFNIKTAPETQCSIKVTLPSGSQSTAKGLEPKISDAAGNISWSWRINWNTKPGTATIEINCTKGTQNFSKTLQMEIVE